MYALTGRSRLVRCSVRFLLQSDNLWTSALYCSGNWPVTSHLSVCIATATEVQPSDSVCIAPWKTTTEVLPPDNYKQMTRLRRLNSSLALENGLRSGWQTCLAGWLIRSRLYLTGSRRNWSGALRKQRSFLSTSGPYFSNITVCMYTCTMVLLSIAIQACY